MNAFVYFTYFVVIGLSLIIILSFIKVMDNFIEHPSIITGLIALATVWATHTAIPVAYRIFKRLSSHKKK